MGLGLSWAAEEMLTFSISYQCDIVGVVSVSYLYVAYLPAYSCLALVLLLSPRFEAALLRPVTAFVSVCAGAVGVCSLALFPASLLAVILSTVLMALASITVNCLWFSVLLRIGADKVGHIVIVTAAFTAAATLLWALPARALLLTSVVFLVASFASYVYIAGNIVSAEEGERSARGQNRQSGESAASHLLSAHERGTNMARRTCGAAVVAGVCVLSTSFGFLQYTVYHFVPNTSAVPGSETIAHLIALLLLMFVIVVLKDTDHVVPIKCVVTLMLFAYVVLSISPGLASASAVLVAGAEGALELVMILSLAELGRDGARTGVLFGSYALIVGATQFVGCLASIVEHIVLPSESYSLVGLVLVALLIISAIWLLTDKSIAELLWDGGIERSRKAAQQEDGELDRSDAQTKGVAQAFRLTPRETEVLALLAKGRSSSFIAEHFCVSNNTVRSHVLHIYEKLDVHSRQELITLVEEWDSSAAQAAVSGRA